jgi:hypothetical protein
MAVGLVAWDLWLLHFERVLLPYKISSELLASRL